MSLQPFKTKDGSTSLFSAAFDEPYHSRHGAIQESQHVFIQMGLEYYYETRTPSTIKIFEMGFGTGLNALLAYQWANEKQIKVEYSSIEKFPLSEIDIDAMNYAQELKADQQIFRRLHQWRQELDLIGEHFFLQKHKIDLQDCSTAFKAESFDLIFFDAFAPSSQPELWEVPIFKSMLQLLKKGGVLTTYCAKGQVRRNMIAAGFTIEKVPGPPGKREMLRASK